MVKLAIFVSGSGTNCENLIEYFKDSESVKCALVVSNKADAYALVRAEKHGVPTAVMPKAELNDEEKMMALMKGCGMCLKMILGCGLIWPSSVDC